jgi:hypothetical protein
MVRETLANAETVTTIAADPRHLDARIGMTSALHTCGSALTHHPHVHMIVPGGGLSSDDTRWVSCRPGFLLPVRVLSRLFRRLFLEGLSALHGAGKLAFFDDLEDLADPAAFATWRERCARSSGRSTPSHPSAGPRPFWPASAATPTASPSRPPLRTRSAVRNSARLRLRFAPLPHQLDRHRTPLSQPPPVTRKSVVARLQRRLPPRCPRPNASDTRALSPKTPAPDARGFLPARSSNAGRPRQRQPSRSGPHRKTWCDCGAALRRRTRPGMVA